jgi:hypothetical protein
MSTDTFLREINNFSHLNLELQMTLDNPVTNSQSIEQFTLNASDTLLCIDSLGMTNVEILNNSSPKQYEQCVEDGIITVPDKNLQIRISALVKYDDNENFIRIINIRDAQ